ncbi:MAG: hypothetical protein JHC20_06495 [Pyrobaculum sp.]|nr:hypothetical protein [Pyrobaculum sp.]
MWRVTLSAELCVFRLKGWRTSPGPLCSGGAVKFVEFLRGNNWWRSPGEKPSIYAVADGELTYYGAGRPIETCAKS